MYNVRQRSSAVAYLLTYDAEAGHRVNDRQHGIHSLVLLAAVHDERRERDAVLGKVGVPLLGVKPVDVGVGDEQSTFPRLVDCGEMIMLGVKDIVDKLETW